MADLLVGAPQQPAVESFQSVDSRLTAKLQACQPGACYEEVYKDWDKALGEVYRTKRANMADPTPLVMSERNWLADRDKQFGTDPRDVAQGRVAIPGSVDAIPQMTSATKSLMKIQFVRDRVRQLSDN
jgi:uncharacterized protein YecT (DUF1311 family)